MTIFPYIYRWDRHGRKGEPCRVAARSIKGAGKTPLISFGAPAAKNMNSVAIVFEDGFSTVTSGNALKKRKPV